MRSWGLVRSCGVAVTGSLLAASLAACSERPEPTPAPRSDTSAEAALTFDPEREPNAAVLPLVPAEARDLTVTDFDEIRSQLGVPDLTSADPKGEREEFWRKAATQAPLLLGGMLLQVDDRLEREFGWTQDDVDWEAHFGGPEGVGWVLKLRDDLPMGVVASAVDAGVGPLAGAEVRLEDHLVVRGAAADATMSWAADPELTALVGTAGTATYLTRECLPFDDVFGPGVRDELAPSPAADVARLEQLGAFSVVFGGELATVRLGAERTDVFDRLRLPETLPATDPEFGRGYQRGSADPLGGRIGYYLGDPAVASRLALEKRLPFAVCAD